MSLTGSQTKQLTEALLSAFPTHSALARLVRFELDENLDSIATGNLSQVVFDLVMWAEAHGKVAELVSVARDQNRGNAALKAVSEALLLGATRTSTAIAPERATGTSIKVLFVCANPAGTVRLALDEEIREITSKIRGSANRNLIELVPTSAVRPDDLLQLFYKHMPDIVHFSGRGSPTDEIVLQDGHGDAKPVSEEELHSLFLGFRDIIQLVLLNACYSVSQAEAITKAIASAIGMNRAIGDKAAMVFASSFYRALGLGRSVQGAFDQGKAALTLVGVKATDIPELLVRDGVDPSKVLSVRETP